MPPRLRIGIIGLGRRWRRYRPSLSELRDRLLVRAVCDERPARAERAARELGCAAAAGPTDLLDREDVEAVLLLDAQWFGLWPLEQAARLGKPVLCAVPILHDDAHADEVMRQVRAAELPVMAALAPALSPALTRLREALRGPPRLMRCDWIGRGRSGPEDVPGAHVLPALLHACAGLIGSEPISVWTTASAAARCAGVLLEFPGGRAAQLNLSTEAGVRPTCRIQATTAALDAVAELPYTFRWRDRDASHTASIKRRPLPRLLLERFLDALSAGAPLEPSFDAAYRALLWTRAVRRSLTEGRRVELAPTGQGVKTV